VLRFAKNVIRVNNQYTFDAGFLRRGIMTEPAGHGRTIDAEWTEAMALFPPDERMALERAVAYDGHGSRELPAEGPPTSGGNLISRHGLVAPSGNWNDVRTENASDLLRWAIDLLETRYWHRDIIVAKSHDRLLPDTEAERFWQEMQRYCDTQGYDSSVRRDMLEMAEHNHFAKNIGDENGARFHLASPRQIGRRLYHMLDQEIRESRSPLEIKVAEGGFAQAVTNGAAAERLKRNIVEMLEPFRDWGHNGQSKWAGGVACLKDMLLRAKEEKQIVSMQEPRTGNIKLVFGTAPMLLFAIVKDHVGKRAATMDVSPHAVSFDVEGEQLFRKLAGHLGLLRPGQPVTAETGGQFTGSSAIKTVLGIAEEAGFLQISPSTYSSGHVYTFSHPSP
jgi:hypothetical protein